MPTYVLCFTATRNIKRVFHMESSYPIIVVDLLALNSQCTGRMMKNDTSEGLSFLEGSVKFATGNCPA